MLARFRSALFAINASYWFYPALFAIGGFVLALVLVEQDRAWASEALGRISWLHAARPEGAANILTVLAGSMIGVAATVFSITIAAVAYASGTYGPRLLTNFMEDKGNQLALASFIGTFVYAITVLRAVRMEGESGGVNAADAADAAAGFVPQAALLVGFALMLAAVGVLVYFLHHIPASIRINTVIEGIGRGLLDKIARRYPESRTGEPPHLPLPSGAAIEAEQPGYIRYIALNELAEQAAKHELIVALLVRTGDFLHPGKPLARVDRDKLTDDEAEAIRQCIATGGTRTPEQDLEFAIDELVEVGLRALSPGINDPFTAIIVIHWLGAALACLGKGRPGRRPVCDDDGAPRVLPLDDDFAHFLARSFGSARSEFAGNPITARVTLDTLRDAALVLDDPAYRAMVAEEARLLMDQAERALVGPALDDVRAHHACVEKELAGG